MSSRALDTGFRGAVLLRAGYYRVAGPLRIQAGGVVLRGEGIVGKDLDQRALGVRERDGLGDAGRNSVPALGFDAVLGKLAHKVTEVAARRDLEGELGKRIGSAGQALG